MSREPMTMQGAARKRVSVGGIALGAYMPARDAAAAVLALSTLSSSATPPGVLENPVVQLQASSTPVAPAP